MYQIPGLRSTSITKRNDELSSEDRIRLATNIWAARHSKAFQRIVSSAHSHPIDIASVDEFAEREKQHEHLTDLELGQGMPSVYESPNADSNDYEHESTSSDFESPSPSLKAQHNDFESIDIISHRA